MKLLLILLNVFSILSLILAQKTQKYSEEECQVYNSIANKIYNNSKNVSINCCNDDFSQCYNGHITNM